MFANGTRNWLGARGDAHSGRAGAKHGEWTIAGGAIALRQGSLIGRVNGATGVRLRITRGRVWATQEGDGGDYILTAGRCVELRCPGVVIVQALEDSELIAEEITAKHDTPRKCA